MRKARTIQASYAFMQLALWGVYGFLFSYANRYLLSFGLSDLSAGVVLGVATAISFLLQPTLTALVDKGRLSCKLAFFISVLFMLLCCVALPVVKTLWAVVLLYALACVALQVLPSFSNAIAMYAIHQGSSLNFGLARGMGSVSFGLCAQLAVPMMARWGMQVIPLSTALLCLVMLASVLPFAKDRALQNGTEPTPIGEFFRKNRSFLVLLTGTVLLYVGHNILSNAMYRIAQYKGDADAQGTALLIAACLELPVMFLFTYMKKWKSSGLWVCFSSVFFTLRILLCWLLPGVTGLYIAQTAQMLGFALFTVSSVYYVGQVICKADVVKGQTYLGAANTLGCLFAYLLSGVLIELLGVGAMLIVCSIISAVGTVLVCLATDKKKETAPQ